MKRWLKRHGRRVIVGLGVLAIANASWGIINADAAWKFILHSGCIALWVPLIAVHSGVLLRFYTWWEKD